MPDITSCEHRRRGGGWVRGTEVAQPLDSQGGLSGAKIASCSI